jgi:hypothetical protein
MLAFLLRIRIGGCSCFRRGAGDRDCSEVEEVAMPFMLVRADVNFGRVGAVDYAFFIFIFKKNKISKIYVE